MKKIFFALIILLFNIGSVFGGNSLRKGTCGALELIIPIGSRATAMGGSVVADTRGTEAIYWNPAGMANTEGTEVIFSYLNYIADIKYSFIGITTNLGNFGSLGFNTRVMNIGEIIVTTEESPDGTGEIITPNFIIAGFSYSRQMTDRVFFGSSMSVIHERIMQETARGVAFDFGFQYIPGVGGLKLGVVMKNIGPKIRFDGSDLDKNIHWNSLRLKYHHIFNLAHHMILNLMRTKVLSSLVPSETTTFQAMNFQVGENLIIRRNLCLEWVIPLHLK